MGNDSDPYAKFEISFDGSKETKISKVIGGNNSPTFNDWIWFDSIYFTDSFSEKFRMKIFLFDEDDYYNDDDFLGKYEGDFTLKPGSKDYWDKHLSGAPCSANSRVSFTLKIE